MDSRKSQEYENRASEILRQKEVIDGNTARFYETIGTISRSIRKGDWSYLHRHPEIRAIIRVIVTEAIKENPRNIFTFAAKLFDCDDNKNLISKINKQLKWIDEQIKKSNLSSLDEKRKFSESSDVSAEDKETECKQSFKDSENKNAEDISENPCGDQKEAVCPENIRPNCLGK